MEGVISETTRGANKVIKKHCSSQLHVACVELANAKSSNSLKKLFHDSALKADELRTKRQQIMGRLLVTAYYAVKLNVSYRNHESMVGLQIKNGIDMGTLLFSEKALKAMVAHISDEMRKKLLTKIITEKVTKVNIYANVEPSLFS